MYNKKLRDMGKVIAEATGAVLYSFDPGLSFLMPDGTSVDLDGAEFIENLVHTLKTGIKPKSYSEIMEKKRKDEIRFMQELEKWLRKNWRKP